MNKKVFSTSLQIPVFQLDTRVTYTEVKKPSGLMYTLMIIFSELSNDQTKLAETLKSYGIPENLHDMLANALDDLLSIGVVKLKGRTAFALANFSKYKISDFALTPYGKELLRKQLIPTKIQKPFEKTFYFSVPEETLTLDAKNKQTMSRILPKTIYNQRKHIKKENLKNKIKAYPNSSISHELSKNDVLKSIELPDENIKLIQQKRDINLTVTPEGTLSIGFEDRELNEFFIENYNKRLLQKLFKEKKKFKFLEKVTPVEVKWDELQNLRSIDYPKNLNDQSFSKAIVLGGSENTKSNFSFFSKNLVNTLQSIRKGIWAVYWTENELWYRMPVTIELPETNIEESIKLEWVVDIRPDSDEKAMIYDLLEKELCKNLEKTDNFKVAHKADKLLQSKRFIPAMYTSYVKKHDYDKWLDLLKTHHGTFEQYPSIQKDIDNSLDEMIDNLSKKDLNDSLTKISGLYEYSTLGKKKVTNKLINSYLPETNDEIMKYFQSLNEHDLDNEEVFNALNIPSILMQAIVQGDTTSSVAYKKVSAFIAVNEKLKKLTSLFEMNTPHDYRIPFEDLEWQAFKEDYRILNKSFDTVKAYKDKNKKAYNVILSYINAFAEIYETLNFYNNPSSIKKMDLPKLKSYASHKPDKFLIHFHQRIEKVLKNQLNEKDKTYSNLLKTLKKGNEFTNEDLKALHSLRVKRNKYIHDNDLKPISSDNVEKALAVLFDLEGRK